MEKLNIEKKLQQKKNNPKKDEKKNQLLFEILQI